MTVMLSGLAVIRIEMSLLEMGVHLMILYSTSFRTMNATLILMFPVIAAGPDLVSLIRGSFSKPCSSDLGKAQNVPSIALELVGEPAPVLFRKHVASGRSMLLSLFLLSAV